MGFQSGEYSYVLLNDGTAELTHYKGGASSLNITDSLDDYTITSIGDIAFSDCTGLTSVKIPDSVTSVGEEAFSGCRSLSSVTILDSVTIIEDAAFAHCKSLNSLTIPNSVTSIKLKSEEDIDQYVADIKEKLMELLHGNNVLHII